MTTTDFVSTIDKAIAPKSLVKQTFYQAWTAGTLPLVALQEYARQYFHFEAAFPTFLSAIHARMEPGTARQAVLENLWDEEHGAENHLALWLRFCESLGLEADDVRASMPNAETLALVEGFRDLCSNGTVAEGLAALYGYESQAPEIAVQKIAGLREFYGFEDARGYAFFSLHQELDVHHSAAERDVFAAASEPARPGIEAAARTSADRRWRFLDGAYQTEGGIN